MNENRISIELSPADISDINAAINTLTTKLKPFLIALENDDKASLSKMSDKSIPFVEKTMQYIETNPEFVPPFLDKPEAGKDFKGFTTLRDFLRSLEQLVSNLEDTAILTGSETYRAVLAYYDSIKAAKKLNVPNAAAIYDDLSIRFEAQKVKPKKPASNP